jgi:hypothetical protein
MDGSFLHSTCGAYELLFWDTCAFKQMTSGASALRDERWDTWTTVLGWPVQEIFIENWDGSDVNMVWRSNNVSFEPLAKNILENRQKQRVEVSTVGDWR